MKTHFFTIFGKVKWGRNILFLLTACLFLACGGSKNTASHEDFEQLKKLVESREFEIEHDQVFPSWGGMIYLTGKTNYIRFEEDSVSISLSYFGEAYSGGYGDDVGINYNGTVTNFEIVEKNEKQQLILGFEVFGSENLQFYITLFPNRNASTSVNSSARAPISYRGEIEPIEQE